MRHYLYALVTVLVVATPAASQTLPPFPKQADLSGPRFGVTVLPARLVGELHTHHVPVRPVISQFGWQFEKQFYRKDSSVSMVTEWIALAGGLDQGLLLPSLSWMVGLRTKDGAEFGIGPNVSPAGTALVFAAGMTFRAGVINVPFNFAVVPSRSGSRFTVLSGFSLRN